PLRGRPPERLRERGGDADDPRLTAGLWSRLVPPRRSGPRAPPEVGDARHERDEDDRGRDPGEAGEDGERPARQPGEGQPDDREDGGAAAHHAAGPRREAEDAGDRPRHPAGAGHGEAPPGWRGPGPLVDPEREVRPEKE